MNNSIAQVIVQNYDNIQRYDKDETVQAFKKLNTYHPEFNPNPIPWGVWHSNKR